MKLIFMFKVINEGEPILDGPFLYLQKRTIIGEDGNQMFYYESFNRKEVLFTGNYEDVINKTQQLIRKTCHPYFKDLYSINRYHN